jgi:hypothetical protein
MAKLRQALDAVVREINPKHDLQHVGKTEPSLFLTLGLIKSAVRGFGAGQILTPVVSGIAAYLGADAETMGYIPDVVGSAPILMDMAQFMYRSVKSMGYNGRKISEKQ